MPKIKSIARSPHIDMTPMVDLFSLLLTFFILTATFRPTDPAKITIPASISEKVTPEKDILTIFISPDKGDKANLFFNFDNGKDTSTHFREKMLDRMAVQYRLTFTREEKSIFSRKSTIGTSMSKLHAWINEKDSKVADAMLTGVPADSIDNQFEWWIVSARNVNPYAEVAIKADGDVPFPAVKKVLDMLQKNNVNKFNLITTYNKQEVGLKDIPK